MSTITSSLLEKAQTFDPQAWQRLVHLYSPLVYRWCRQSGLQPQDAENVGQEVFVSVHKGIEAFQREAEGSTFRGWLRRITQRKIADYFRHAATEIHLPYEVSQDSIRETVTGETAEETKILYHRIVDWIRDEFEEHTWQAFYRVVVDGQKASDVADELGMSVNSVYLAKSRVLRRVREFFRTEGL